MKSFKQYISEANRQFPGEDSCNGEGDVAQNQNGLPVNTNPYIGFIGKKPIEEDTAQDFQKDKESSEHDHRDLVNHYKYENDHVAGIRKYSAWSEDMNKALHHGTEMHPQHKQMADEMDAATKHNVTPKPIKVYSGIQWHPGNLPKSGENFIAHQKAFTSTSLSKSVASLFAMKHLDEHHHMIELDVPKGSHGAYIAHHSMHPHEREFTLPKNSKMAIHHEPTIEHRDGTKYKVWKARLIHDGTKDV